jgi:hypothetical protein
MERVLNETPSPCPTPENRLFLVKFNSRRKFPARHF